MKLEAGKTYLNRKGERVKVELVVWPFADPESCKTFTAAGSYEGDKTKTDFDLIAEAPEVSTDTAHISAEDVRALAEEMSGLEFGPTPPAKRKIVQIASADRVIYALCNDGTVWLYASNSYWLQQPEIPQPE